MDDKIEMAVEVFCFWYGRLDFWRKLEHDAQDAEISQELAEKAATAEREVARLRAELEGYGATVSEGGVVIWKKDGA